MSERQLALEAQAVRVLREALVEQGCDEDALDLSVASETNFKEVIASVYAAMLEDEALVVGIEVIMAQMKERGQRLEQRTSRRRNAIEKALIAADLQKLELPSATLFIRAKPPALTVYDEGQIIDGTYWTMKPQLNRQRVKDDLKAGKVIPGARLDNGGMGLTVRVA